MRIFIKTRVNNQLEEIQKRFDQDLFEKLSPPLVKIKIDRFDGCLKDHEVHLLMNSLGVRNKWVSKITVSEFNHNTFYFIDEGIDIPFPLQEWKHVHRVEKVDQSSCDIIDDINFSTGKKILDLALYPFLFGMFKYRQPIYKRELE